MNEQMDEARHVHAKEEKRKRQIREAMARLDGRYTKIDALDGRLKVFDRKLGLPTTITYDSHDDVQRVFGKLSHDEKVACYDLLFEIVNGYEPDLREMSYAELVAVAEAKPNQWVEAILRAKGVWDEG